MSLIIYSLPLTCTLVRAVSVGDGHLVLLFFYSAQHCILVSVTHVWTTVWSITCQFTSMSNTYKSY